MLRALLSFFKAPLFAGISCGLAPSSYRQPNLRAPAIPLVAVDPYFSIWSPADRLTDAPTMHWTEAPNRLTSLVQVDGKAYRIMGDEPKDAPALEQTGLKIMPTSVVYSFAGAGVRVELSFIMPLLPEDLMIFSRPVTYLEWQVSSTDGREHEVQFYFDASAELVVHDTNKELVIWSEERFGEIAAMKMGSQEQPVLRDRGDRVRINWGYLYVAVPDSQQPLNQIAPADIARSMSVKPEHKSTLPMPVLATEAPVLSVHFDLGKVSTKPASRYLVLAYDDVYSAQFFKQNLKGYWTKDGDGIKELLAKSVAEFEPLKDRCAAFDEELIADLNGAAGPNYAWLCALAYRQSCAASKVVADSKGQPLYFCKENTSNGCMGTVDVFYPQSPLYLLMSPSLSKATLVPILEYASSSRWKWSNAPHDVGCWPQANGQIYGGEASNGGMPVEESGNMLLLIAAVSKMEGNADFASIYWPTLTEWAEYLEQYGRDPENQLCTDDFAGHLAHNANLAGKAICALAAYGKMAAMKGDAATAERYISMAKEYAQHWLKQADDGDHFRLAYDQPGSWSSKYNLVWDKILDLGLFPDSAIRKEMAFYRKNIDEYGLPLDGRLQPRRGHWFEKAQEAKAHWSKTDWAIWTACLTNVAEDFEAITKPIFRFMNETSRRVGMSDLYFTDKPDIALMHSRPVMGGAFIRMLYDEKAWKKWASRDHTKAQGPWAPLPQTDSI